LASLGVGRKLVGHETTDCSDCSKTDHHPRLRVCDAD
jgi:hypothetical protein